MDAGTHRLVAGVFLSSLLTFTWYKIKQQISAALWRLAEGRQLRGHYRMAESLAKEALKVVEQLPKHDWTIKHIEQMFRSSHCAATIARQMGRFTEAEVLL